MAKPEAIGGPEFTPLSEDLQRVIDGSKTVAREYNSQFVEPQHIFLALLRLERDKTIQPVIQSGEQMNLQAIIKTTESLMRPDPNINSQEKEPIFTRQCRKAFVYANSEAESLGQDKIETRNMLTGIILQEQGPVTAVLQTHCLTKFIAQNITRYAQ